MINAILYLAMFIALCVAAACVIPVVLAIMTMFEKKPKKPDYPSATSKRK